VTSRLLVLLLLAGPAALLATALGGWWLARKALLPVHRMASKADGIGIDRLDERIAAPHTQDEIGHLAVTLNAMLDRLERGVEEKRRLVADASHELRTPLAAMRAELDISLRGDDLTPAGREVLESTLEEAERAHILSTLRETRWVLSGPSGAANRLERTAAHNQRDQQRGRPSAPPARAPHTTPRRQTPVLRASHRAAHRRARPRLEPPPSFDDARPHARKRPRR